MSNYFRELTLNLQHAGFVVKPETDEGLLPVELDGQRLCLALDTGTVRYWREDVADDYRSAALDRVNSITKATAEYMSQLADFNGVVLAGHPTRYGVQFVTWERSSDRTSLGSGHYYGPGGGADSYTAAKRDFATRSGLIPRSALFDQKQLIEIYHCSVEVQAGLYSITDEQGKCLQSIIDQIELSIPNLGELLDQEQNIEAPEDGGMQFS
ncbi:hypothetical protein [Flintibacter muris]|uniref:hypothetical protein n=1 Tax=Flintibacter muris TaxID=2941327 RepID=UPI00203CEE3A|nr:hypothetical protein [Flintibacter muris]